MDDHNANNTASATASNPGERGRLIAYGTGEAAFSVVNNGLYGFALLFYTDAIGISAAYAGLALSISVFWEAITEPVMGFVSDRTRSRFGSRYPWIALGSVVMAVSFYAIWIPPLAIRTDETFTFAYLVVVNIALRSGMTMFFIPYLALGFEMVPEYDGRTRLQGVRWICNMAANFAGPALAWIIFFADTKSPDGSIVKGTSVIGNYEAMGAAFAVAVVLLTMLLLLTCRKTAVDNRHQQLPEESRLLAFWSSLKPILMDVDARHIFGLIFLLVTGMVIFSSLQAYLYVHFMIFSSFEKSVVHGSTMAAAAIGALLAVPITRWLDKKGAIIFALTLGLLGLAGLALTFLTGAAARSGVEAIALFIFFQGLYWLASGIVLPVATAMIGDAAELRRLESGQANEGGYSAIFSLMWRGATALSLLVAGWLLTATGVDGKLAAGGVDSDTVWNLGALAFGSGAVFYGAAMLWATRYRLDRHGFDQRRAAAQADGSEPIIVA
jgi:glycoside/pentoside/hexuronide:cation symporter, GPH family